MSYTPSSVTLKLNWDSLTLEKNLEVRVGRGGRALHMPSFLEGSSLSNRVDITCSIRHIWDQTKNLNLGKLIAKFHDGLIVPKN